MIPWIFVIILIVSEVIALRWWLQKEYYPVIFNGWAVFIYASVLALDFSLAWMLSVLFLSGNASGTDVFAILFAVAALAVAAYTLFFKWIARQELGGPQ